MMDAAEALAWIEARSTLHVQVDIRYVVDGYQITITYDGEPIAGPFWGPSLVSAIGAAKGYPGNA